MKVLIVKMSSLGDVIHTLPAIEDAYQHRPDIQFDWVIEEAFQEIPAFHPAVRRVIPIRLRAWRKKWWAKAVWQEIWLFIQQLRENEYDVIIDAQGLLKSALVSRLSKGKRAGLNFSSAREPIASLFYHQKINIPKKQQAITRIRALLSHVLGYPELVSPPQLNIPDEKLTPYTLPNPYLVFLHATTWPTKHWPETYWVELTTLALQAGYQVVFPWGNAAEKERADRLSKQAGIVLPALNLKTLTFILKHAAGCIAVDTGLGHLSALLGTPTLSLYGATSPHLTGTVGKQYLSTLSCAPCLKRQCRISADVYPPCMSSLMPESVFHDFLGHNS
jgi:heptosyltransferase-1